MERGLENWLEVRLAWAVHHRWEAGREQSDVALPVYALRLLLAGSVVVETEAGVWSVAAGEALLSPPGGRRRLWTPQGGEWLAVGLRATLHGHLDPLRPLAPAQWRPAPDGRALLEAWLRQLVVERQDDADAAALIEAGLSRAVVGLCGRMLGHSDLLQQARAQLPSWLEATLRRVQEQPHLGAGELARAAGFSPAQFRRNFARWLGMAPRDYLLRYRLETARRLLETTDLTVAAIAERTGSGDAAHFSRLFKRAYTMTPAQCRHLARQPQG